MTLPFFKSTMCAALVGAASLAWTASAAPSFSNPVLNGDFPDPSVVRVGTNYYATATSAEWGPLFPILRSTDLVNWDRIGSVFPEKPAWSSRNYWAPEITHYRGRYYVYYVGRKNEKDGPLAIAVATADRPEGPYTDHGLMIAQPEGSIDPFVINDDNGDRYMFWKNDGNSRNEPTFIFAQKLNEDATKLVGESIKLLRNDAPWEGSLIEGPFVLKRDGWFYLFYSGNGCCGKQCTYGVGVARSRKLLGPYEKCPANPILVGNETWKCPGHGSFVETPDHRWFFLYHAYHHRDFVYVGRQGMLDDVRWGADGWPAIGTGNSPSVSAPAPFAKAQRKLEAFEDDFTNAVFDLRWQWPHSSIPQYKLEKGWLELKPDAGRNDPLCNGVLAVHTVVGAYDATVALDTSVLRAGLPTKAGLCAYGDRQNVLGIVAGDGKVMAFRRQGGKLQTLGSVEMPLQDRLLLRLSARDGHHFRFAFWTGKDWQPVGAPADIEGDYLPPWDRGVRLALTVGSGDKAAARFDWLKIVPAK